MKEIRRMTAVAMTAAVALGVLGCGDDEPEQPAGTPTATATATAGQTSLTPGNAIQAAEASAEDEPPAAKPNVLGGTGPIARVLQRVEKDVDLFYQETLVDAGAKLTTPNVARSASGCNGENLAADAPPQWCDVEKSVFTSEAGADKLRNDESIPGLYTLIAWSHARAVGSQLGWHDGVRQGRYKQGLVTQAEFCLTLAWITFTYQQGVFEGEADSRAIDATINAHIDLFPGLDQQVYTRALQMAREGGALSCVGS
jgi:hypothetical protein